MEIRPDEITSIIKNLLNLVLLSNFRTIRILRENLDSSELELSSLYKELSSNSNCV